MNLPADLREIQCEIQEYAGNYGLDFYDVIFEMIEFDQMNELAGYGGFPTRYPHWHFAMEYERLRKSYAYGLHKIYEMVINNNPCYAYLLKGNGLTDQKLVMAHVYAHCDFFKNNAFFAKTNRKMMDQIANHASQVHRLIARHGALVVEQFLDICLSLQNLIDIHSPFIQRKRKARDPEETPPSQYRLKSKDYMETFINPDEFIEQQKKFNKKRNEKQKAFPPFPENDVLLFFLENAPLKNWQYEILNIIRDEAYYFAPQGQTKIMNEGWATYWHSKMMTQKILQDSEVIDYADHHSATVFNAPGQLNPYKIGFELFKDIEERWDKGRFGKEYEACENLREKKAWDKQLGLGLQKIFEVRRLYNDVTFIDTFLTEKFCVRQKLFSYEHNAVDNRFEVNSRKFKAIKEKLLADLTNIGVPKIQVVNANYRNRNELRLLHQHEGIDLKLNEAKDTLQNLQTLWKRPVHLETIYDERRMIFSCDGEEHSEQEIYEN